MATTTQLPGSSAPALLSARVRRAGLRRRAALRVHQDPLRPVHLLDALALVVVTIGIGALACAGRESSRSGPTSGPEFDADASAAWPA